MAHFDTAPLQGQDRFGAIVTALDPATLDRPDVRQALHDLWIEKGVIVFRGIAGGLDTQLALSEIYGEPEVHPLMAGTDVKSVHKAIAPIEFDQNDGNIYEIGGELVGGFLPWHFDAAYVDRINHGGILRPHI